MKMQIDGNEIHVGDIVKVKFDQLNETPHLVVEEVVQERLSEGTKRLKYRCRWFLKDNKKFEFKEIWLSEDLLEHINSIKAQEFSIGALVNLKTVNEELVKTKDNEYKTKFSPPKMSILGFDSPKSPLPLFDKDSKCIREIGNLLVKCMYYDTVNNKFSEILLPAESLTDVVA